MKSFETKATREILSGTGIISSPDGLAVDTDFDFVELQDFNNGVAGRRYNYGKLRYPKLLEQPMVTLMLRTPRLMLRGGGIQAALHLHNIHSFSLVGPIYEISEDETLLS
jgi:hypothetical protein